MWHRSNVKQGLNGAADKLQGDVADVHEVVVTPFLMSSGEQESKTEPLESLHLKTNSEDVVADGSSLVSAPCVDLQFEVHLKNCCIFTSSIRLDEIATFGYWSTIDVIL